MPAVSVSVTGVSVDGRSIKCIILNPVPFCIFLLLTLLPMLLVGTNRSCSRISASKSCKQGRPQAKLRNRKHVYSRIIKTHNKTGHSSVHPTPVFFHASYKYYVRGSQTNNCAGSQFCNFSSRMNEPPPPPLSPLLYDNRRWRRIKFEQRPLPVRHVGRGDSSTPLSY